MGRTVSYSVVKRKNPQNQDAAPKFYAQAQANGHVEIREMADRIQRSCTVTRADVMAVLVALEDVIVEALEGGEIVKLADLGTFRIGLSGTGAETEEGYDVSMIQKARINFRPGIGLSSVLSSLKYTRVEQLPVKAKDEPKDEEPAE